MKKKSKGKLSGYIILVTFFVTVALIAIYKSFPGVIPDKALGAVPLFGVLVEIIVLIFSKDRTIRDDTRKAMLFVGAWILIAILVLGTGVVLLLFLLSEIPPLTTLWYAALSVPFLLFFLVLKCSKEKINIFIESLINKFFDSDPLD